MQLMKLAVILLLAVLSLGDVGAAQVRGPYRFANQPAAGGSTLLTGLEGAWLLEDVTDSHGSNDLTNNNTVTFVAPNGTPPANMPATVANFVRASTQYLSRSFTIPGSGSYTYAVWVYLNDLSNTQSFGNVNNGGWIGNTSELGCYVQPGLSNQVCIVGNAAGTASDVSTKSFTADSAWHLMMTTYDADAGSIQVYRDNVAGSAASLAARYSNANSVLRLGVLGDDTIAALDGQLSGAILLSRVATSDERDCIWNSGAGGFYPYTGLCN